MESLIFFKTGFLQEKGVGIEYLENPPHFIGIWKSTLWEPKTLSSK